MLAGIGPPARPRLSEASYALRACICWLVSHAGCAFDGRDTPPFLGLMGAGLGSDAGLGRYPGDGRHVCCAGAAGDSMRCLGIARSMALLGPSMLLGRGARSVPVAVDGGRVTDDQSVCATLISSSANPQDRKSTRLNSSHVK